MTEPGDDPSPTPPEPDTDPSRHVRRGDIPAVSDVCPLLQAVDGGWRSAYASRDHRCWATTPAAQLAVAKQRQLCLVPAHAGCTTYLAAEGTWSELPAGASSRDVEASLLWPAVRSTPLTLEPSRGRTGSRPATTGRAGGQALLVALMALAFLVLVIARAATPSGQGPSSSADQAGLAASAAAPGTSASPGPAVSASASAAPAAPTTSPEPVSTPAPRATPAPTRAAPVPTKVPAGTRRYTVQRGDTLSGIAAKFGTTVAAVKVANGIKDPRLIRVGQVLVIP